MRTARSRRRLRRRTLPVLATAQRRRLMDRLEAFAHESEGNWQEAAAAASSADDDNRVADRTPESAV